MNDRDKAYLLKELTRTIDESDSTAAFCLCQRWILKDALALLKEQEAVKPKLVGVNTWICGECEALLGWEDFSRSGLKLIEYKFCPECGHEVKWE